MSKSKDTKKVAKKEPAKTMKEKKAAKREKKTGKSNSGLLDKWFTYSGILNLCYLCVELSDKRNLSKVIF